MNANDIKWRIDELRLKKGWSLSKLAKEAGLAETTVYNWFNENNFNPSRKTIASICEALGISLAQFYSGIEEGALSPKQVLLLELFGKLSEKQQDNIIEIIRNLAE